MTLSRRDFIERFGKGLLVASITPPIMAVGRFIDVDLAARNPKLLSSPLAAFSRPAMISRAGWGCAEPNSSVNWPSEYREVQTVIVHHTVTRNNDSNPAATIRAIWYYHAVTLGWGDIGYNFLVDTNGNIYEGRYGGLNVVGGHAKQYNWGSVGIGLLGDYQNGAVPAGMREGLTKLLTWLSYEYGVNPTISSYFIDKSVPNILGHRDCLPTTCPGANAYSLLASFRSQVWARLPQFGVGWGRHATPTTMKTGQTLLVNVDVFNRGTTMWNATGQYPYHLGYHWYDEQGQQYVQAGSDDFRTALPTNLIMGQKTTVRAKVAPPRKPGIYTLKWDMVQEGVTWMATLGESPLSVTVRVSGSDLPEPSALQARPSSVTFMAKRGASPQSIGIEIMNEVRGAFAWTATVSGGSWVKVSSLSGSSNSRMTVTLDPAGLGTGKYQGQIVITASTAIEGSPLTIPVELYVADNVTYGYSPESRKDGPGN